MYLNSKSYEKKYKKYKNKYQILKSNISGVLLNGGECSPLPNPEEDDFSTAQNLLDLCPEERITIQNKCYDVKGLYTWIIEGNKKKLPITQTDITTEDKQRLIQAYKKLTSTFVLNVLTRDKLIQIYPNLQQEIMINLSGHDYVDIALGTFDDLPNLRFINLSSNYIEVLQPDTFNNLPSLEYLNLDNNHIHELHSDTFNNLPEVRYLNLKNNNIQELHRDTFKNLPRLYELYLDNNPIEELQPIIFYNKNAYFNIRRE